MGREVQACLRFDKRITLLGAGVDASHHLADLYQEFFELPVVTDPGFQSSFTSLLNHVKPDIIYPTHDDFLRWLIDQEGEEIVSRVVFPGVPFARVALDKHLTYSTFRAKPWVPSYFELNELEKLGVPFPLFLKPKRGQGANGAFLAIDQAEIYRQLSEFNVTDFSTYVACEYLPGREYTIELVSNKVGNIVYLSARERAIIRSGLAVHTRLVELPGAEVIAQEISITLSPIGAWFIQLREDNQGRLKLLEIGARQPGGSALSRARGANLAALSYLVRLGPVQAPVVNPSITNVSRSESDEIFTNSIPLPTQAFFDLDDTLLDTFGNVNQQVLASLNFLVEKRVSVTIITRHTGNPHHQLERLGLVGKVMLEHLTNGENKAQYIPPSPAGTTLFVDDSYRERLAVRKLHPQAIVLPPESIELIRWKLKAKTQVLST